MLRGMLSVIPFVVVKKSLEEMEAKRKAEEDEAKKKAEGSGDSSLVTKSDMMIEMRSMIQELMGLGLIGGKADAGPSKLKLEIVPKDVKLEGNKNYLSWSRRVRVLLGGKEWSTIWRRLVLSQPISSAHSGEFGMQQTL
jgi:hypothetical protein